MVKTKNYETFRTRLSVSISEFEGAGKAVGAFRDRCDCAVFGSGTRWSYAGLDAGLVNRKLL